MKRASSPPKLCRLLPLSGIALLAILAAWALLNWKGSVDHRSDVSTLTQNNNIGYRIEDGVVAWRPMTSSQQVAATIVTLGMALGSEHVTGRTLPLADATTFEVIGPEHGRDNDRVWYHADEISGADPQSFEALKFGFSRDKFHIWRGINSVMELGPSQTLSVRAHSERIFSAGTSTWLVATPLQALAEAPISPPIHYCRNWFTMNEALWDGPRKVMPFSSKAKVVECDGGISTVFENGIGIEDVSQNKGILLRSDASLWRVRLGEEPELVVTLPKTISAVLPLQSYSMERPVMLVQDVSGEVSALGLHRQPRLQSLGHFSALPKHNLDLSGDGGFWLDDHYLTLADDPSREAPLIIDHGPSEPIGRMALSGGMIYYGEMVVARPGDLPLRKISPSSILVGSSCLDFGNFISDVPDPAADVTEIIPLCQTMFRPPTVLYEGLSIEFSPNPISLGPHPDLPEMTVYRLGEIVIENVTNAPIDVPSEFLEGLVLRVMGKAITPPVDAWPADGLKLDPDARHRWPLEVRSDGLPLDWGWVLQLRHSAPRASIFGTEPVTIGYGDFRS